MASDSTTCGDAGDEVSEKLDRIAAFLGGHALTLNEILDVFEDQPGEECMLFVGSVPEGTSTRLSDADFIVIGSGPGPAELTVKQNGVAQVIRTMGERLEVCAAYYSPDVFQSVSGRIRRALSAIGDPRPAGEPLHDLETLDRGLLKFAHQLKAGVVVRGSALSARESLNLQYLDDYLVTHGILEHYIHLEDMQGELEEGFFASAAYTFTYSMNYLAGSVLAMVGETNPDRKWRLRLLERERHKIGGERANRLSRYLLGSGDEDPLEWIRDGLRFSAEIVEHCLTARPLSRLAVEKVRKAITVTLPE